MFLVIICLNVNCWAGNFSAFSLPVFACWDRLRIQTSRTNKYLNIQTFKKGCVEFICVHESWNCCKNVKSPVKRQTVETPPKEKQNFMSAAKIDRFRWFKDREVLGATLHSLPDSQVHVKWSHTVWLKAERKRKAHPLNWSSCVRCDREGVTLNSSPNRSPTYFQRTLCHPVCVT